MIDLVTNDDIIIHNTHSTCINKSNNKSEDLVLFAVSSFKLCQLEDKVQSAVLSFAHSEPGADRVNSLQRKEERGKGLFNGGGVAQSLSILRFPCSLQRGIL